jgi:RTX calcium-binding nonapeptide repeat (4 copies)
VGAGGDVAVARAASFANRMRALGLALLALLATCPSAEAARVWVPEVGSTDVPGLVFEAAAGEANALTVTRTSRETTVVDTGATLRVGQGCRRATRHRAICRSVAEVFVGLGNRGDAATVIGVFSDEEGWIAGGRGNDVLSVVRARLLNTSVSGGDGSDRVFGGFTSDYLLGGRGNDVVSGGGGSDSLVGGGGNDVLRGGRGADLFAARDRARDHVYGGAGRDRAGVDAVDLVRGVERFDRRRR